MKKYISLFLIAVFLLLGFAISFAEAPSSGNTFDFWGRGGATGSTPPTMTVKVRYGRSEPNQPSLSSGDVVVWDVSSSDGMAISACMVNNAQSYAGVLVTSIATKDGIGTMAIKGYVLAKVDTSAATAGTRLIPNGGTLMVSFASQSEVDNGVNAVSVEVGVLLQDTGADGLMPVWLR